MCISVPGVNKGDLARYLHPDNKHTVLSWRTEKGAPRQTLTCANFPAPTPQNFKESADRFHKNHKCIIMCIHL